VNDITGVGVQSAQLVVSEGASVVITDDIGTKALDELTKLRVPVYVGVDGTAQQALDWYLNGRLSPTGTANAALADDEEHGGGPSENAPAKAKEKAKGETTTSTSTNKTL